MDEIQNDVIRACHIAKEEKSPFGFGKIYYSSNESLQDLFHNFSLEGKEVLTVLGSSDQYFYSYYNGAKKVDTFDVNQLTKYYYYLRLWNLKYRLEYYPNPQSFFHSTKYIYQLLKQVVCESFEEENAYCFWDKYVQTVYPFDHRNLFHYTRNDETIMDPSTLLDCLQDKKFSFISKDLMGDFSMNHSYDVVIISNILEYYYKNIPALKKCCENLKSLLNEEGVVIASHMVHSGNPNEYHVFSNDFDLKEFPYGQDPSFPSIHYPVGYSYTKKKC